MTTLKCQNCGGTIELNSELPVAFCPYCGAKSLIDEKNLGRVYVEKEKTKRSLAETDRKDRSDKRDHQGQMLALAVMLFIVLFSSIILRIDDKNRQIQRQAEIERLQQIEAELVDAYSKGDYDTARIKATQLRPENMSTSEAKPWNTKRAEYIKMIDKAEKEASKNSS